MKLRRRRLMAAAIAGTAIISIVTACSRPAASKSSSSSSNETVRIGVGIDSSYAPFFLADHDGMFKKAGLDVKVVQFGRGGDAVQAIAGKQVEFAGNSDTTTITLLQQNPDLRAMFIYEQSGKYLKVVARPGIQSAAQIKKMGVVPGLSAYFADKYFQAKGIDPKSVKFVTADPPELPSLTKKGDVDAYLLWEPWPTKGEQLGLKVLTDTGSYGYSYVHWMVGSATWLQGHEELASKVAAVIADAERKVASDPQAAAEAVSAEAKIPVDQAKQAIEEVTWQVRGFTDADMKSYDEQVKYLMGIGALKSAPDLKTDVLTTWFDSHVKAG